jgi:hypothetical protein
MKIYHFSRSHGQRADSTVTGNWKVQQCGDIWWHTMFHENTLVDYWRGQIMMTPQASLYGSVLTNSKYNFSLIDECIQIPIFIL